MMMSWLQKVILSWVLLIFLLEWDECKSVDNEGQLEEDDLSSVIASVVNSEEEKDEEEEGGGEEEGEAGGEPENVKGEEDEEEENESSSTVSDQDEIITSTIISAGETNSTGNETGVEEVLKDIIFPEIEVTTKVSEDVNITNNFVNATANEPTLSPVDNSTKPHKIPQVILENRGILSQLQNIFRGGNFSRKNVLHLLQNTRKTVEHLEDLGIVNEYAAPILIGDDLLGALEGFFGR